LYIANLTAGVFNNSEGESMINASAVLLNDIQRLMISFRVAPTHVNDSNANLIKKGTADACKISKGIIGSVIIKMVQESLTKYSNIQFKCNMVKGFYYMTNAKIDDSLVPLHLFGQQLKFTVDFKLKSKIVIKKPLVEILSLQLTGITL